ncbi:MAG: mevalonate kinase [Saprospiraceae bacterium]|nr:mevalonate kinase [Lewinella sp.]
MKYLSKLLLFGEYTVINGSRALAVPYNRFYGEWELAAVPDERLLRFAEYLDDAEGHAFLNVPAFSKACREGWIFRSNIPLGYGLGSSGALCAAVYDRFAKAPIHRHTGKLNLLKRQLAWMESFFHGASSGTDPLISYLNYPVVIHPQKGIREISLPDPEGSSYQMFLLDTGLSRSTGPLVDLYLKKCGQSDYASMISGDLVPLIDQLIDDYLNGAWKKVCERMQAVSDVQWQYFPEMIPEAVRSIWKTGLEKGSYSLKLCGAGGGGFLLGMSMSEAAIDTLRATFPCYLL